MSDQPVRVVFLDRGTIAPQTTLRPFSFPHELIVHERSTPEEAAGRIADADMVIVNKVKLSPEALRGASRLKLVAVAATGTDNVDLATCTTQGIVVSNIRDYAINTVPEHTLALMFALRRSIVPYVQSVRAGRWQEAAQFCYFDYPIRDLAGSTLGIIGEGTLGQAVGRLAQGIGMRVLYAGRKGVARPGRLYAAFDTVLAESDVITLHCPLTPQSQHLLSGPEFSAMQRRPLLINTARAGLVDQDALAEALRSGQISGAAIDVATPEPPAADSLLMQLATLPNVLLTPHVGWASDEAMQTLADQLVDNIEAFYRGEPRHVVNPPCAS